MQRLSWRVVAVGVAVWLLSAAPAHAKFTFAWSVPEVLGGGTVGVARSVEEAAQPQPSDILLQTCVEGKWTLDGAKVTPIAAGRCLLRLHLEDHRPHKLKLSVGGASIEQVVQARDLVIVSIGDSVASGEGNPDVPALINPQWLEKRCHRSMRSGAAQAAEAIAASDPHTAVVFLPLACSGATVPAGLLGPFAGVQKDASLGDLPPQLDEVEKLEQRRHIDAVLLSIGANDVYFGPLVRFCVFATACPQRRFDPAAPDGEAHNPAAPTADEVHAAAQRSLPSHYRELHERLARIKIEPAKVIIVEYFDPTHDQRGNTCEQLLHGITPKQTITPEETEWAQTQVLDPLNAAVREAARLYEWKLVAGVQRAFLDHGICASDLSWVRGLGKSIVRGAWFSGTLHPNSAGHLATAALIAPVLADVVGVDPGGAVAQTSGAKDNENTGVAWWWLLVAVLAGAVLALLIERKISHP